MPENNKVIVGVAWYRPEQWSTLVSLIPDAAAFPATYADWLARASDTLRELRKRGIHVTKVDVELNALLAWAVARGRVPDGSARAEYAQHLISQVDADRGGGSATQVHSMRIASQVDVPLLVQMMSEFYAGSPYTLNQRRAKDAFKALLTDKRLGRAWFILSDSKEVGYVVVTFCHSMAFGGQTAIVDDFFIRPEFQGAGLGKAALEEVRSYCASHGVRAIHVETGRDNLAALAVYRRTGFVEADHVHLTLRLAEPTHAP